MINSRIYRRKLKLLLSTHSKIITSILIIALISISTFLILGKLNQTPRAPRLKAGSGDTLYSASNKTFSSAIGTKDGLSKVSFSVGDSSASFILSGANRVIPQKINSTTVLFPSVFKNTDLKYSTTPNGLKEEIILTNQQDKNVFLFDFNLTNLNPKKTANNFIEPSFRDSKGRYQFHFEKPFAVDASGNRTNNVILQIREDSSFAGNYSLKLIVDSQWLSDPSRTYPITIDPTIVHDTSSEFFAGYFDRLKDTGSGTIPTIESYYQELPADRYTVGLWHFNDDPSSAITVSDASPNQNTGTLNGTTASQGVIGYARNFNGTSDYISMNSSLNESGDITIESWFKTTENGNVVVMISYGTTSDWLYWFGKDASNFLNCKFYQANSGAAYLQATSSTTINDGKWHHGACVMAGTTLSLYLDGVLVNTVSNFTGTRDVSTAGNFFIGKFDWTTTYNFPGDLDEVRISSIARSAEEIKSAASRRPSAVYTSPVLDLNPILSWNSLSWNELGVTTGNGETPKNTTGLLGQWNFNETSGTTADNSEGTASRDLTLTGFDSTSSQDSDPDSSWTANNRRWGAGALQFDGSDSYAYCTDANCGGSSALDFTASQDFTLETWFKTNTTGTTKIILSKRDSSAATNAGYTLFINASNLLNCRIGDGTNTALKTTTNAYTDGQWHHVVCTIDRTAQTMSVYIDGILVPGTVSTSSVSTLENANEFRIGALTTTLSDFKGVIDSTRLYSRTLSPSEIMSNYQAGNIELQTRVGATTNPNDGTWEDWKPTTGETTIDNMNNPLDYATPSASIFTGPLIATSTATFPVIEGNKSLKIQTGQQNSHTNVVGLWHLEESNGSSAYIKDSSPNANNLTPTGSNVGNGIVGKGRIFNGTSDYLSCTDAACGGTTKTDPGSNPQTISAWVKTTSTAVQMIVSKSNSSANIAYHLYLNAGTAIYTLGNTVDGAYMSASSTTTVNDGKWHYIVGTFATGTPTISIYVDGVLSSTNTTTTGTRVTDSSANFEIGRYQIGTQYFFNGTIDEVQLKNVANSAEEIAESYRLGRDHYINKTIGSTDLSGKTTLPFYVAADRPGSYLNATLGESLFANYQPDSNTRGFWHLDEASASGSYIKDAGGAGNHLTPTGAILTDGKIGKARYFNGASQYLSCTDANCGGTSKLDPSSGSWSVGAWAKTTKVPRQMIVAKGTASGQYAYNLEFTNGGSPVYHLYNSVNASYINASASARFNDGLWHHFVGTYDGTTASLYVDGILQASSTTKNGTQVTDSTSDFQIGARTDGTTFYWNGYIDEVFVTASAPSVTDIRQMYQVGSRTHPITIDFSSAISHSDPLSSSADLSFTLMATPSGTTNPGDNIYPGDKIIVKENYDGTEYIAQGLVDSVNVSSGATTVSSWDGSSTFPSGGFTPSAVVFKWQREYWSIDGEVLDTDIDATTNLTLRVTSGGEGRTIWLDDLKSNSAYLTTPGGSTITSATGNRYFQYRAILSSFDEATSATLSSVTIDYLSNVVPATPSLDSPTDTQSNRSLTPSLLTTATDTDSDYLRYKIELCTNVGMTTGCQTFDQTSSQTGWSGQNAQTSTAYTSGTQATYTVQTPLTVATTYYWRSYAIDPGGANTWSSTQTPYSFTTTTAPSSPTTPYTEGSSNPTEVIDSTPEFSAIHSDPDSDSANYYEIEVNTNNTFTGTVMWDSGAVSMANLANGVRSSDVSYGGTALTFNGATYYWRIKFTDTNGATGSWSATQNFTMNTLPTTPTLDLPTDSSTSQLVLPVLKTTGSDTNSDYLRYKIELCTNVGMTTGCQTFDQTSSQTGWSGQNAQTSTAYTSGTQATYTVQTPLTVATTYYWRSYAIDPGGANTWSSTQTPYSFATLSVPETATQCRLQEKETDTSITLLWTDNGTSEDGYRVDRSVDGGGYSTIAGALSSDSTSYTDSTVTSGHTYVYRVAPYFTGPLLGNWCTVSTLTLETGIFKFNGLNFSGIKLN